MIFWSRVTSYHQYSGEVSVGRVVVNSYASLQDIFSEGHLLYGCFHRDLSFLLLQI